MVSLSLLESGVIWKVRLLIAFCGGREGKKKEENFNICYNTNAFGTKYTKKKYKIKIIMQKKLIKGISMTRYHWQGLSFFPTTTVAKCSYLSFNFHLVFT